MVWPRGQEVKFSSSIPMRACIITSSVQAPECLEHSRVPGNACLTHVCQSDLQQASIIISITIPRIRNTLGTYIWCDSSPKTRLSQNDTCGTYLLRSGVRARDRDCASRTRSAVPWRGPRARRRPPWGVLVRVCRWLRAAAAGMAARDVSWLA
eukprot:COSAG02_NODE_140_length_34374_cov_913.416443_13_plen_153_part_00